MIRHTKCDWPGQSPYQGVHIGAMNFCSGLAIHMNRFRDSLRACWVPCMWRTRNVKVNSFGKYVSGPIMYSSTWFTSVNWPSVSRALFHGWKLLWWIWKQAHLLSTYRVWLLDVNLMNNLCHHADVNGIVHSCVPNQDKGQNKQIWAVQQRLKLRVCSDEGGMFLQPQINFPLG